MTATRLVTTLRYGDTIQRDTEEPYALAVLRIIDNGHPYMVLLEAVTLTDAPLVVRHVMHRRTPVTVYNAAGDIDDEPDYGNPFGREGA